MQRAICCATLRSNFEFHRRIMNRYANPRIGIITHSCDIVFSHAVNRACFTGPTTRSRRGDAGRRDATRRDSLLAAGQAEEIRAPKTGRGNYKRVYVCVWYGRARARDSIQRREGKIPSQTDMKYVTESA